VEVAVGPKARQQRKGPVPSWADPNCAKRVVLSPKCWVEEYTAEKAVDEMKDKSEALI